MAASFFFHKNKKGRSQNSPSPVPDLDEGLDSSNEIFGQTPDTSTLGVTLSPIKRTEVNTSLGASFRSPQVILDSDESSSQGDPKDLHRDLLEEDNRYY